MNALELNQSACAAITIEQLTQLAKEHPKLSFFFSNGKLHVEQAPKFEDDDDWEDDDLCTLEVW